MRLLWSLLQRRAEPGTCLAFIQADETLLAALFAHRLIIVDMHSRVRAWMRSPFTDGEGVKVRADESYMYVLSTALKMLTSMSEVHDTIESVVRWIIT